MGIIRKQSVLSSVYIYIGFAIGAVNVLFLFPNQHYFKPEEFGLTRLLLDVSLLIAMFCTLGTCPATLKFYPFYNSYLKKENNDLPFITTLIVTIGCTLFLIITPFLKDLIVRKYVAKSPLFVDYFYLIYPMVISMAFLYLFEAYSWSLRRTVFPAFLREVLIRVLTTVLIVLIMFRVIDFRMFANLYGFIYVPAALLLLYTLIRSGDFKMNFRISSVTRRIGSRMIVFSLFIFGGQAVNVLARTLDSIIIASQSKGGLIDTAVFTLATYLVALMDVPLRGMQAIAFAVLSQAWRDKNLSRIKNIYQKTALNLLIPGLGIYCLLILNTKNVITFLGPTYTPIAQLILVLGAAKIIDLGTGLNSQILLSSKYWKIDFLTNVFLVMMSAVLNYILVRKYGVIGSSYANFIAFTIYNAVRFLYIWKLFKMQPFTFANLKTILIAAVCFIFCWIIPQVNSIFLDSLIRSILFVLLFGTIVIILRISDDINTLYKMALQKIRLGITHK